MDRKIELYPRSYFEEPLDWFKEDCIGHGEFGFEYKGKTYAILNGKEPEICECEDFLNDRKTVKRIYKATSMDELFDAPIFEGKSLNEIYADVKTFN